MIVLNLKRMKLCGVSIKFSQKFIEQEDLFQS